MSLSLPSYPRYKDSGLPWLGQVPEHWELKPILSIAKQKTERGRQDLPLLSVYRDYGVILRDSRDDNHNIKSDDLSLYKVVNSGDLVLNKMKTWQGSLGVSEHTGVVSPAYIVCQIQSDLNRRYLHLLLRSKSYITLYNQLSFGVRVDQWDMRFADFKRIPVILPPREEQDAIVRFLTAQDSRFARLIRAKRRMMELLNEQKSAIIHRAVTRGLDESVRLKASGLPWLGNIPEHWEVERIKYLYREVNERSETGEEELMSVSHLTGVTPRRQKNITMFMAQSYVGHKMCRRNDLVINTMWAWMGALGTAQETGIVSPSYGVYRPTTEKRIDAQFADYLFRLQPLVSEYLCQSTGIRSSRLRLYPEQFLKLRVFLPPLEEQIAIVRHIESAVSQQDKVLSQIQREIDLILEYRTRLVRDVVTGQLDVREAASKLENEPIEELELVGTESEEEELELAEI
jgi:type I restriction enzyme, S subunit